MSLNANLEFAATNVQPCLNRLATLCNRLPRNIRIETRRILFSLVVLCFSLVAFDALADPATDSSSTHPQFNFDSGHDGVWQGDIGDGFRKHAGEAGVNFGGGFGLRMFGGRKDHDVVYGDVHAGTMLSGLIGEKHFWRGNFELLGDLFGGEQINHNSAYMVGLTPLLRYDFATGSHFIPFIGGGAGVALTDIRKPDLSTDFEFNIQVGGGVHWFFKPDMSATLEGRWLHLSNAGIDRPNQGVNTSMILVGLNWFF
jgi:lipid A 3-O-deacylase